MNEQNEYTEGFSDNSIPDSFDDAAIDSALNETLFEEDDIQGTVTPSTGNPFTVEYEEDAAAEDSQDQQELLRQQRAAARRKRALREQRRKKRRRQAILRCGLLLLILILLLVGIVKLISGIHNRSQDKKNVQRTEEEVSTEATTEHIVADIDEAIVAQELPANQEEALAMLKEQGESNSSIQSIYDNAAVYPENLLQAVAVNSEMVDFVVSYPAKISTVFDGDFTMEVPSNEVPLYLQFDMEWGYADYGNDIVALSGAGPTCLSMAYTYLKQDGTMNPIKVADYTMASGYLDNDGNTSWLLFTEGVGELGLASQELDMDEDTMIDALNDGKLIVCSVNSGDFTKTTNHFILIREYKDGLFYVNDPTSTARSQVGWDYDRLAGQISKMCALSSQ